MIPAIAPDKKRKKVEKRNSAFVLKELISKNTKIKNKKNVRKLSVISNG